MMTVEENDLPARVRAIRRSRGWTQPQMAEAAGMKPRAYQMFEGRQSTPQPENLRGILRAAGLNGDDMDGTAGRSELPRDIKVFLDMLGAYLMSLPEARRLEIVHNLTRQIFQAHRAD